MKLGPCPRDWKSEAPFGRGGGGTAGRGRPPSPGWIARKAIVRFNGSMKKGLLALCTLAVVLSAASASVDESLERVIALAAEDRLAEARRVLDPLLARDAGHPWLRLLDGVLHAQEGRVREAIEVFDRLRRDHPEMPEPWNNLAVVYAAEGRIDEAREALLAALERRPSAASHANLGEIHAKLARRAWQRARELAAEGGRAGGGRESTGRRPRLRRTLPEVRPPAGWPRRRRMPRQPARPTILGWSIRRAFAAAGSRTAGCSLVSRSGWSRAVRRSSRYGARGTARPGTSRCTFRPSRTVRRLRPGRARSAREACGTSTSSGPDPSRTGSPSGCTGLRRTRGVASRRSSGSAIRSARGKPGRRFTGISSKHGRRRTRTPLRAAWKKRFPDWPLESVDCG